MTIPLTCQVLRVGACRHAEAMAMRGGRWRMVEFPALCALIHHPRQSWILYDTGYADHFFTATATWPECLYRRVLPVVLPASERLDVQLTELGILPEDIGTIIVSHFHGDHIAGLRDFPQARILALHTGASHCLALHNQRWRATLTGHLPALLPPDFTSRWLPVESCPKLIPPRWLASFPCCYDLCGDGSLLGVPLPGHDHGQLGLYLPDAGGRSMFLVADACWSLPALRDGRPPSSIAGLINNDQRAYVQTFHQLRILAQREPAVTLIPSHCTVAWRCLCQSEPSTACEERSCMS